MALRLTSKGGGEWGGANEGGNQGRTLSKTDACVYLAQSMCPGILVPPLTDIFTALLQMSN